MPALHDWLLEAVSERGSSTGSATALVYRDTYLSWRGLAHRVDRRARELGGLGIGEGTWVGVMLGNVPEFVIIALALSKLKAVMVPLDPTTANRDLDMVLEAAPMRALITRPGGADLPPNAVASLSAAVRAARRAFQSKFVPESRRRLQGTLLTCSLYRREPMPVPAGEAPAVVLFTADAGGDPKGVVRTDAHLRQVADSLREVLACKSEDHNLCVIPLHAGYGFDFGLLASLACKSTLFLEDEISPKILNRLIRDNGITFFPGTPTMFASLARVLTVKPLGIKGTRFVSSGSSLAPAVAEMFHQRFGVRLLSCYHTTETGPVAIDRMGKDPATVGKAFAGVELRVASAAGKASPVGRPGPIWARSGGVSNTSVPELTGRIRSTGGVMVGRASADGWFRTGDVGSLDKAGRLTITGREDDLVKVNGKRVALGEVEGCLEAFAKVREAQARVELDELGGPMVVARVVRNGSCRAEELIDHCARNLAPYKVPRQIEFCEQLG